VELCCSSLSLDRLSLDGFIVGSGSQIYILWVYTLHQFWADLKNKLDLSWVWFWFHNINGTTNPVPCLVLAPKTNWLQFRFQFWKSNSVAQFLLTWIGTSGKLLINLQLPWFWPLFSKLLAPVSHLKITMNLVLRPILQETQIKFRFNQTWFWLDLTTCNWWFLPAKADTYPTLVYAWYKQGDIFCSLMIHKAKHDG
jgi:hypothetical protein